MRFDGPSRYAYREGGDALAAERARFAAGLEATLALRVLPSAANFLFCEVLPPLTAPGLAQGLYLDHAILIKDCSTKAGLEGQPFVRIAIRGGADNDRFLAALRQVHARALRPEAGPGRRGGG